jgi:hypothetical protein
MMTRRQLRGCNPGEEAPRGEYTQFLKKHFENWESDEPQQERLARFWVQWNLRIEEQGKEFPYFRFRIEDMDEEMLLHITSLLDIPAPPSYLLQFALRTDKSTNHDPGEGRRIVPWAKEFCSQTPGPRPNVRSLGKRYGYGP